MIKSLFYFVFSAFAIVIIATNGFGVFTFDEDKDEPCKPSKELGLLDSLGKRTGFWQGFCKEGKIGYEGYYIKGDKDSVWKYYNKDGNLIKSEMYKNGLLNGNVKVYRENLLYDELQFANNKKHGKHIHYYKNGKINFIQEYNNGIMDGEFSMFSNDGVLIQKGFLKNGKNRGEWINFSDQGDIISKKIYDSIKNSVREIKFSSNGDTISDKVEPY